MVTKLKYQSTIAGFCLKVGERYLTAGVERAIKLLRPFEDNGMIHIFQKEGRGRVKVEMGEEIGGMVECLMTHEEWLGPVKGAICQASISKYELPKIFYAKLKDV